MQTKPTLSLSLSVLPSSPCHVSLVIASHTAIQRNEGNERKERESERGGFARFSMELPDATGRRRRHFPAQMLGP